MLANRALQTIVTNSKSDKLTRLVRDVIQGDETTIPNDSESEEESDTAGMGSDDDAERLYRGKPESEWKSQFERESEPVSKLESAKALLSLASVLPPSKQLERILFVGEEIVLHRKSNTAATRSTSCESWRTFCCKQNTATRGICWLDTF